MIPHGPRTFLVTLSAVTVGLAVVTGAPAAAQSPDGQLQAQAQEPVMSASAHAIMVLPQADLDDAIETSLGARATFAYRVAPWVSAIGAFEYIAGNVDEDFWPEDSSAYLYSLAVGARFHMTGERKARPYGEILLGRYTGGYDSSIGDDSQSDLGFRLGGGLQVPVADTLDLMFDLAYSTVELEILGRSADLESFNLGIGLAWSL